jgi:hypothetical protein
LNKAKSKVGILFRKKEAQVDIPIHRSELEEFQGGVSPKDSDRKIDYISPEVQINDLLRLSEDSLERFPVPSSPRDTHHSIIKKKEDQGAEVSKFEVAMIARASNPRSSMASGSSISDGSIANARVEPGSPSDAEDGDAFDDDEYFEEFERETTVTRPSESGIAEKTSIIDASLDALSRLSGRISSAMAQATSSVTTRGSLELSLLGRGRKGFDGDGDAEGGSASIAMTSPSTLHSASLGANASETSSKAVV